MEHPNIGTESDAQQTQVLEREYSYMVRDWQPGAFTGPAVKLQVLKPSPPPSKSTSISQLLAKAKSDRASGNDNLNLQETTSIKSAFDELQAEEAKAINCFKSQTVLKSKIAKTSQSKRGSKKE